MRPNLSCRDAALSSEMAKATYPSTQVGCTDATCTSLKIGSEMPVEHPQDPSALSTVRCEWSSSETRGLDGFAKTEHALVII